MEISNELAKDGSQTEQMEKISRRKGSRKVRTGCMTCKVRKVKCDEARPGCKRCAMAGRTCAGYGPVRENLLSSRVLKKWLDISPLAALGASPTFVTYRERRSFEFFRYVTAPVLASDYDADFWFSLVFKFCHIEGAVRHAVLGLSCLHETLVRDDLSDQALASMEIFTLQQYNQSISSLTDCFGFLHPSQEIATLATSILFVCMEFMQKKDAESLGFLQQGRRLLRSIAESHRPNSYSIKLVKQQIVPMYLRVGLTALIFGWSLSPVPMELDMFTHMPGTFSTIAEARNHLYATIDASLRWRFEYKLAQSKGNEAPVSKDMQSTFLSRLSRWYTAFSLLTATLPTGQAPTPPSLLLQIYYHFAKIMTSATTAIAQTQYDSYVESFSAILLLSAKYLRYLVSERINTDEEELATCSNTAAPNEKPGINLSAFSFEPGVVPALYFTAVKCRHPHIRRTAVDMLLKHGTVQENLWKAHIVGCVAARYVEIEAGMAKSARRKGTRRNTESEKGTTLEEQVEPPFGLADDCRLVDVVVGPPEESGLWVTFVKRSQGADDNLESWKEFIMTYGKDKLQYRVKTQVCRGLELSGIKSSDVA